MSYDTTWDVDKYKTKYVLFRIEEYWQWARAFLIKNKKEFYEICLVDFALKFIKVKFLKTKYRYQTMALLKYLSDGLVVDWRDNSDADATPTKKLRLSASINNYQSHVQNIEHQTPYDNNYILPGFILMLGITDDPYEILVRSCTFSNMALPFFKYQESDSKNIKVDLYIQTMLIASSFGSSRTNAIENVLKYAYYKLKQYCFAIKIKKNTISINEINGNVKLNLFQNNKRRKQSKKDNKGNKVLKVMDLKHGTGVIRCPKKVGLGYSGKCSTTFNIQYVEKKKKIKGILKEFINTSQKLLSFSIKCTAIERKLIHETCTKFDLISRSYGELHSKYIVVFKKENSHEVFQKLIKNGLEDDYYELIPPTN